MSKLQEIKDQVAREYGYKDWDSAYVFDATTNIVIDEVAHRYATAIAEDVRKRATKNCKMLFHDGTHKTNSTIKHFQSGADHLVVDKQSILSTPIKLL